MATVTITGGTGLIGTALTHLLIDKGHRVIILSRKMLPGNRSGLAGRARQSTADPTLAGGAATADQSAAAFYGRPSGPGLQRLRWDPASGYIDPDAIREADYIVHLAGAGVADHRWSARRKKVIDESRTGTGDLIVRALREV